MSGKRESTKHRRGRSQGWWGRHRAWVAGMTRGELIRYRVLQILVILSVFIIGVWLAMRAWVKLPELPQYPAAGGDSSQTGGQLSFDGAELPDVAKSGRRPGVYTFLLVGQDTAGGGNTDTMILLSFDSQNKTVHGMSLPRDTMINVARKGAGHRLNAVYNYNKGSDQNTQVEKGMTALKKEVSKLTGILPDFYVVVQWEAVGKLVEAIGGVSFDVPFDMDYDDPTPGQDLHIHLKAGLQTLDGEQAMGLIRWRHNNDYSVQYPNGDLGRVQTQQAFLKAVAAECLKPEILLKATSLAQIFMENVTTDLSLGNLLAFAQLAMGMDAEQDVTFVTMPNQSANYPRVSMVLPVVSDLLEVLNDGFNPYVDQIQSSDLQVLYRNSNGSYGVTGGALLDSSLASARGSSSGGSHSSGGSESQEPEENQEEIPQTGDGSELPGDNTQNPGDSSETPGGETQNPGDGSELPGGETQNPGDSPETPGGDAQNPGDGSEAPGGETGGETGTVTPPTEDTGGSQDIQPGSSAVADAGGSQGESGLTVSDLPSWLNPSGAEPAA